MGQPELGTECTCARCAERFYDLNRSPAIGPKCGTTQPPNIPRATRLLRTNFSSPHISRRPSPAAAEEDAQPLAAGADEEEEDADEMTEIDAELDADVDPTIVG